MALVKYNGRNVYRCNGIKFLPKVNEVDDELLEGALKQPLFKYRIEEGIIVILEHKTKKKSECKKLDRSLDKVIPDIYDEKLLQKYISESEDKEVVKASKKQLKKIDAESKLKLKDKDG